MRGHREKVGPGQFGRRRRWGASVILDNPTTSEPIAGARSGQADDMSHLPFRRMAPGSPASGEASGVSARRSVTAAGVTISLAYAI